MKSVVDDTLKDDLAKVPFGVFGIEADEATDTSNESIIVTLVRYVNCIRCGCLLCITLYSGQKY